MRTLLGTPLRLGVGLIDQVVPFHTSARVWLALPVNEVPTATQYDELTQDTENRWLSMAPLGLGDGLIDQVVPFHTSTSVWSALPLYDCPTATQYDELAQDTAYRTLLGLRSGVGVIDQLDPFQTSASGPLVDSPTATHCDARPHDTALSEAPPLGSGVGVIDHDHVLAFAPIPGAAIPPACATTGVPAVSVAVPAGVTVPAEEV
jgi:hypothetical protein